MFPGDDRIGWLMLFSTLATALLSRDWSTSNMPNSAEVTSSRTSPAVSMYGTAVIWPFMVSGSTLTCPNTWTEPSRSAT